MRATDIKSIYIHNNTFEHNNLMSKGSVLTVIDAAVGNIILQQNNFENNEGNAISITLSVSPHVTHLVVDTDPDIGWKCDGTRE